MNSPTHYTHYRKTILFVVIVAIILFSILLISAPAHAQTKYEPLAPLPGASNQTGGTTFKDYLPGMFQLLIGLSGVLAVLMLVIGGFQYLSTDSIYGKSEGKERIRNAIVGLVFVIVSWLVLNTINPALTEIELDFKYERTSSSGSSSTTGNNQPSAGTVQIASILGTSFTTWSSNSCSNNAAGCTYLGGVLPNTARGTVALKGAVCPSSSSGLVITGAAEPGHSDTGTYTHAAGYKLDISDAAQCGPQLTTYLNQQIRTQKNITTVQNDKGYSITNGGYTYCVRHEASTNHWDIGVSVPTSSCN